MRNRRNKKRPVGEVAKLDSVGEQSIYGWRRSLVERDLEIDVMTEMNSRK